jgi:pimeloyl-ACP methyl ester carboxylesterase
MQTDLPPPYMRYNEALWLTTRLWRGFGHLGPRGPVDGPPALVVPGFMASDRSSMELRRALAEKGFRVYGWNQGVNGGAHLHVMERLKERVNEIYDGRPILLVGWSLGGLFVREIAREMPNKIRAVVTLGSPISGDLHHNNVWKLYEWITGHEVDKTPVPRICDKPPVPTLSIWSRNDGLIPPSAACGTECERDEAIELDCTHMAFGISYVATREAAAAIESFLANKE